jgi:WD40 repeat protein/uncharacterized caspase-like protein
MRRINSSIPRLFAVAMLLPIWAMSQDLVVKPTSAEEFGNARVYVQSGHSARVTAYARSNDGLLATGDSIGVVKLWDKFGFELRTFSSSTPKLSDISVISFSSDASTIYVSSTSNTISFDVATGNVVQVFGYESKAFSRDGKLVATQGHGQDFNAAFIELRHVGGAEVARFGSKRGSLNGVRFSADSNYLLILYAAKYPDYVAELWNINDKKKILTFDSISKRINTAAISPDGSIVVLGTFDGEILLVDKGSGTIRSKLTKDYAGSVQDLSFSIDGRLLASRHDTDIYVWNMSLSRIEQQFSAKRSSSLDGVFASLDTNNTLLASDGKILAAWDVSSGEKKQLHSTGSSDEINSVATSRKSNVFAVGSSDGLVRIWDTTKEQPISTIESESLKIGKNSLAPDIGSMAISPDGDSLAIASFLHRKVEVWDIKTQSLKGRLESFAVPNNIRWGFSPDGKLLALYKDNEAKDNSLYLWDVDSGKLTELKGHKEAISEIEFSPSGDRIASGSNDGTVKVWDLVSNNQKETLTGHDESVRSIAFSSDGTMLASAEGSYGGKKVKLWNLVDGTVISEHRIKNPDGVLDVFEVREDLITANTKTLEVLRERVPEFIHKNPRPYYFSYRETTFGNTSLKIAIDQDGLLAISRLGSGETVAKLVSLDNNGWAIYSPDGYFDGTPNAFKQLIWRFDNNTFNYAPVEAFFKEFYRPGLLQEIMSGKVIEPPKTDLASVDIRQAEVKVAAVGGKKVETGSLGQSGKVAETIAKREVEVAVEVTDNTKAKRRAEHCDSSGAIDLRLFRDGALVKKWDGYVFGEGPSGCADKTATGQIVKAAQCERVATKAGEPRKAVCKTKVTLAAGDNQFSAYAFNSQNVKSTDATAVVKGADSLKKDGTLYIFAVGVDKYAATDPQAGRRHDLQYAVADVNKIGEELAKQQIDIKKYARTEVIKLTDQNATKENILLALKRFSSDGDASAIPEPIRDELSKIKRSQPEDAILFHFSGHGTARCQYVDGRKNCDRFYLVPHNGFPGMSADDASYNDKLFAASISDEELERAFEPIDAGNLLMVIDACNSGQALESEEQRRGPMNSRGLAQLAYEKGMMILTASQSQQLAIEDTKYGHGLLTYSLLKGLKEAEQNDQKSIIDRSWFNYASATVPNLQLEAMKTREAAVVPGAAPGTKGAKLFAAPGDNPNLPPEKRGLQSPRLFYRREANNNPFVVARPLK